MSWDFSLVPKVMDLQSRVPQRCSCCAEERMCSFIPLRREDPWHRYAGYCLAINPIANVAICLECFIAERYKIIPG